MRRAWKIAVPLTCAVLISGAMVFEMVHRHHLEQQKLAQQAQAYRVRAEQGDAEAEFHLSTMYLRGQGVPQSYTEAFRWCRRAADQNYARAQDGMGYLYYHGYGLDGDFTEALRWLHLAADQKLPQAENEIGIAYEVGNGVTADYGEAVRWYRLAADQGYAAAEYNLGWMYANGRGITKDRLKARELITRAADHGDRGAKQMLGRSWPAFDKLDKVPLILCLAGGMILVLVYRLPKSSPESQTRFLAAIAGAVTFSFGAFMILSSVYAGALAPSYVAGGFEFATNFTGGILLSIWPQFLWRKSPKWTLWCAGILFVALIALDLELFNHHKNDAAIRFFPMAIGLPLGLGIASAVLLLRAKRGGETDGPSGPDGTEEAENEVPAHP